MRVLIACEFSGVVRSAFRALGHDAWSCDLLLAEDGERVYHYQGDCLEGIKGGHWDLMVAHPPCTHLAVSGARWFAGKQAEQAAAIAFFMALVNAPIKHIAIENPVSIMSTVYRKPDCTTQPWQHGHPEVKRSCWWLKNLPAIVPSNIVAGRQPRVHFASPGPNRWKERSRTLPGVATALADQFSRAVTANQNS